MKVQYRRQLWKSDFLDARIRSSKSHRGWYLLATIKASQLSFLSLASPKSSQLQEAENSEVIDQVYTELKILGLQSTSFWSYSAGVHQKHYFGSQVTDQMRFSKLPKGW